MTATAHAAVGVTLASIVSNPFIGIPIAFASHILCDLTPHWDAGTHIRKKTHARLTAESITDVLISAFVTLFMLNYIFTDVDFIYGITMAFSAQLLDWLTIPYLFLKIKSEPFKLIYDFQHAINIRLDKPWGIVTQISVVFLLIIIAKL